MPGVFLTWNMPIFNFLSIHCKMVPPMSISHNKKNWLTPYLQISYNISPPQCRGKPQNKSFKCWLTLRLSWHIPTSLFTTTMAFGTNSGAGCPALVSATSLQGLHEQFNWNNSTHRPYCNGTPLHPFSAKECLLLMQFLLQKSKAKQREIEMQRGSANHKWSPFHHHPFVVVVNSIFLI